jgi:hypothetical protein
LFKEEETMHRVRALQFSALAVLGIALLPISAAGQQKSLKDQLVGTWTLLIDDNVRPDGTQTPVFGPNPNGIVIFDTSGHYALELGRSNLPKFASNNRANGTVEENRAVVGGTLAHFGTYMVDEVTHTLTFHVQGSTFPNWEQTQQKLLFSVLSPDDLKWETPAATGSGPELFYWKKLKQDASATTVGTATGAVAK